ncbi:MAG: hypothetical protein MI919_26615 [Holophagales bacterium]|nr:hypothetical protein [Holophagales bacterium]
MPPSPFRETPSGADASRSLAAGSVVSRASRAETSGDVGDRLERLLDGEAREARWLYDFYATGLLRRLRGRYPYLEPEDLLQDAFVFYFQNRGKVLRDYLERVPAGRRSPESLGRHLWDLACGLAANRRRASRVRAGTSSFADGDEERLADRSPSLEGWAVDRDELRRLDECLQRRGRRLALYCRLRFWDGYTPNEISEITGWSKKATYKLRQALAEAVAACAESLGISTGERP